MNTGLPPVNPLYVFREEIAAAVRAGMARYNTTTGRHITSVGITIATSERIGVGVDASVLVDVSVESKGGDGYTESVSG